MVLNNKILWLFVAAALELFAVLVYAFSEQTLMITTIFAIFITISVAIGLIYENREIRKNAKAIRSFIEGEIKWLKTHREKLNYKLPEKLKEYTDNRIELLKKLQEESS